MSARWKWPGSRWWRCDFHAHSPGSYDFAPKGLSAADWIREALARSLDVIAVTDHNCARFIPEARAAAEASGQITVLPGVELTTVEGLHLLVVFDSSRGSEVVDDLLSTCGVPVDERCSQVAIARCGFAEAVRHAREKGGVSIAAHADRRVANGAKKVGLLDAFPSGRPLALVFEDGGLDAVELVHGSEEDRRTLREAADGRALAIVHGSDAHRPDDIGGHSTWVKMTLPTADGLRLALRDAEPAVLPGDSSADPNEHAARVIESLEIERAVHLGLPQPFVLSFNPWLNVIVGGRGTGKSTVVEMLRTALRRIGPEDLPQPLDEQLKKYRSVRQGRRDEGLLRDETAIRVIYRKNGARFRISWDQRGSLPAVEQEQGGAWVAAPHDGVRADFPARIFSQGQLFELARRPAALLDLVDAAIDHASWDEEWRKEEARFLALRARSRELDAQLADEGRLRSELQDVLRQLAVFEQAGHAAVLRGYQIRRRQERALDEFEGQLSPLAGRLRDVATELVPLPLATELFDGGDAADASLLADAARAAEELAALRVRVEQLAADAERIAREFRERCAAAPWTEAVARSVVAYTALTESLRGAGVRDPSQYGALIQRRGAIETRLAAQEGRRASRDAVVRESEASRGRLVELRKRLTEMRRRFLEDTVGASPLVRIELVPLADVESIEEQVRDLLGLDERNFENDIWPDDGQRRDRGIIGRILGADPSRPDAMALFARLAEEKRALRDAVGGTGTARLHGKLVSRLAQLKPEAWDRLEIWFPGDGVNVNYSPSGDGKAFKPLAQGSPGQKNAAILAFLLSHGDEPLILDQPENDLDNELIYELVVKRLHEIKAKRQLIVVTHNPIIVVNGDAELVVGLRAVAGQTAVDFSGGLEETAVRDGICRVMEGGREAFERRYSRLAGRGRA